MFVKITSTFASLATLVSKNSTASPDAVSMQLVIDGVLASIIADSATYQRTRQSCDYIVTVMNVKDKLTKLPSEKWTVMMWIEHEWALKEVDAHIGEYIDVEWKQIQTETPWPVSRRVVDLHDESCVDYAISLLERLGARMVTRTAKSFTVEFENANVGGLASFMLTGRTLLTEVEHHGALGVIQRSCGVQGMSVEACDEVHTATSFNMIVRDDTNGSNTGSSVNVHTTSNSRGSSVSHSRTSETSVGGSGRGRRSRKN